MDKAIVNSRDGGATSAATTREDRQPADEPNIRPGQIWLIEQTAATGFFALDRSAFAGADVVLYEPTLAPLLAFLVPPGRYAEPLSAGADEGDPAISRRALKLAADGWSVVQLIQPSRRWRQRLRRAAAELAPLNGARSLPIQLIAKPAAAARCRSREVRVPELSELVDAVAEEELLTLIVGPLGGSTAAAACAFVGNGLAG
jgi:hypothetical protein